MNRISGSLNAATIAADEQLEMYKRVRVQSSSHSEGGVGNSCMSTQCKDDTHKS